MVLSASPTRLPLARLLALVFMLLCLAAFTAGLFAYPDFIAENPERMGAYSWTPAEIDQILSRVGLSYGWWLAYNRVASIPLALLLSSIAFLIYFRKRDDLFSLYAACAFVMFGTLSGDTSAALSHAYPALEPLLMPMGVAAWLGLFLIFFGFPDGRFTPAWTRWAAYLLVLGFGINIWIYGGQTPPIPLLLLIFGMIGVGVGSQVYRYRRVSSPVQRQQTKWVILALLVVFSILLLSMLPMLFAGQVDPGSPLALLILLFTISAVWVFALIPLSIAVAILRYRLWDVDLLIRRTLVYGVITAALGLVYLGGVTVLQAVFASASGQSSTFAIVLSTLAIAALFSPLRRRIQDFIDRRFYRQKYNAEQALSSFAEAARQEADLSALTGKLVSVVQETVQPEHTSIWLRPSQPRSTGH